MKHVFKRWFFHLLNFDRMNELMLTAQEEKAFDHFFHQHIEKAKGNFVPYKLPYPKHKFFQYMIEHKHVLIHGSNSSDIKRFVPRKQSLFNGKMEKAVFAASDGIWPIFFAVVNRERYKGSLRNMCLSVPTRKGVKRYYYFSLSNTIQEAPFTDGTIYILSRNGFQRGGIRDEWISEREVEPVAKISVVPEDFPFLDQIRSHDEADSIYKTLIQTLILRKKNRFMNNGST